MTGGPENMNALTHFFGGRDGVGWGVLSLKTKKKKLLLANCSARLFTQQVSL